MYENTKEKKRKTEAHPHFGWGHILLSVWLLVGSKSINN